MLRQLMQKGLLTWDVGVYLYVFVYFCKGVQGEGINGEVKGHW